MEETHPVAVDMKVVHEISLDILKGMEEKEISVLHAALACLMTVGRLLSEKRMDEDDEVKFIDTMMSYVDFYFMPSTGEPS